MQKLAYILFVISVILSGCSSTRKAGGAGSSNGNATIAENSLGSVLRNNLSNNDFNIQKAEINVILDYTDLSLLYIEVTI